MAAGVKRLGLLRAGDGREGTLPWAGWGVTGEKMAWLLALREGFLFSSPVLIRFPRNKVSGASATQNICLEQPQKCGGNSHFHKVSGEIASLGMLQPVCSELIWHSEPGKNGHLQSFFGGTLGNPG